ncbi:MAG: hypothetical protein AAGJ56_05165 [Myxococcota bacterium]
MATCFHWPGEEPYDERRRQEIQDGLERDCPAAVSAALEVQDQLSGDSEASLLAIRMAAHFGDQFDAKSLLTTDRHNALCAGAKREIEKLVGSGEDNYFPYFDSVCTDANEACTDEVRFIITQNNEFTHDGVAIDTGEIRRHLGECSSDVTVKIEAHPESHHQRVVELMDAIRAQGFTSITIGVTRSSAEE